MDVTLPRLHFAGLILSKIRQAVVAAPAVPGDAVVIDNGQTNGAHGIHQARVRLQGDPRTYRLILAPAEAPIEVGGRPIGEHFALPLGEM